MIQKRNVERERERERVRPEKKQKQRTHKPEKKKIETEHSQTSIVSVWLFFFPAGNLWRWSNGGGDNERET